MVVMATLSMTRLARSAALSARWPWTSRSCFAPPRWRKWIRFSCCRVWSRCEANKCLHETACWADNAVAFGSVSIAWIHAKAWKPQSAWNPWGVNRCVTFSVSSVTSAAASMRLLPSGVVVEVTTCWSFSMTTGTQWCAIMAAETLGVSLVAWRMW